MHSNDSVVLKKVDMFWLHAAAIKLYEGKQKNRLGTSLSDHPSHSPNKLVCKNESKARDAQSDEPLKSFRK